MESCGHCSVDSWVNRVVEKGPAGAFGRYASQSNKCQFGSAGVCCRLCANGPCRITEKSPLGVCGADEHTIVARNFLRSIAAGAACYLHVAENAARTLRATKDGVNGHAIRRIAGRLNVSADGKDEKKLASEVAGLVLADLYAPRSEKMHLIEYLAPEKERRKWATLGILPGGAKAEVFDAFVKTSTNLNSNPTDLLVSDFNCTIAGLDIEKCKRAYIEYERKNILASVLLSICNETNRLKAVCKQRRYFIM